MIGIIAAVSLNDVIGKNGKLPWYYPADLSWFKRCTRGQTVVMGRKTFESIGSQPLPMRSNIIISSKNIEYIPVINGYKNLRFHSIKDFVSYIDLFVQHGVQWSKNIWFIGGRRIFEEAFEYADTLYLTKIPESTTGENLVYFPKWDMSKWQLMFGKQNSEDNRLWHFGYRRMK